MFANAFVKIYLSGIGISGVHGIYKYNECLNSVKKQDDMEDCLEDCLENFLKYPASCAQGFLIGLMQGITWPITFLGKSMDMIQSINIITKNN